MKLTTGSGVGSSPAVANGVVYVGSYDDNVYALNAATGAKLWSFTTGSAVAYSAAVANGVVYVGSEDHNVYALNAKSGAKLELHHELGCDHIAGGGRRRGVHRVAEREFVCLERRDRRRVVELRDGRCCGVLARGGQRPGVRRVDRTRK